MAVQLIVESMRASVFYATPIDFRSAPAEDWWRQVAKSTPDVINVATAQATTVVEGPFGKCRLALGSAGARADWILAAGPAEDIMQGPTSIGPWPDSLSLFAPPVLHWLSERENVCRVAFGAVIYAEVEGKEGGYRMIQQALRDFGVQLPANASDFLFQVNVPTTATIAGREVFINRLMKWSVALVQPLRIQVNIKPDVHRNAKAESIAGRQFHFMRTELDFSSPADSVAAMEPTVAVATLDTILRLALDEFSFLRDKK